MDAAVCDANDVAGDIADARGDDEECKHNEWEMAILIEMTVMTAMATIKAKPLNVAWAN